MSENNNLPKGSTLTEKFVLFIINSFYITDNGKKIRLRILQGSPYA